MRKAWQGFIQFIHSLHPVRAVVLGYLLYAICGCFLLMLPISHARGTVPVLDALFTSVSALSTTGLATVSTGYDYTLFGQIIILLLIQIGGIGYMTFGSFVLLSRSGSITEYHSKIGRVVFSLPEEFRVEKFIRSVIVFTLIIELMGAMALYIAFQNAGVENPLWFSIFHSISAFCTAGFGLYDNSMEPFYQNTTINVILGFLCYFGAIGFIVFVDAWRKIIGKIPHMTLTSRIILLTTFWISIIATGLIFLAEPSIQNMPASERLLASAFQVMTSISTAGFNTVPIGLLSKSTLFLIILLMIVGASPSGTGGGLKTTTFSALFGVIKSAVLGRLEVTFWGKVIPLERIRVAIASLGLYLFALITGCYLLSLTEVFSFEGILFESASALGTVGLSTGITSQLSPLGKVIIIILMFLGRVGPMSFGIAMFFPSAYKDGQHIEDVAI